MKKATRLLAVDWRAARREGLTSPKGNAKSICWLPESIKEALLLKVIAEDFIKPEAIAIVRPLYRELVEMTRREELCIAYDLFVDQKDPGHFIFIEQWPDRAALDDHCATSHFRHLVPLINAHRRKPATFILMDEFSQQP
jgi:quinol monooxygenase YgiN